MNRMACIGLMVIVAIPLGCNRVGDDRAKRPKEVKTGLKRELVFNVEGMT